MYIVYMTICLVNGQVYVGKHNQNPKAGLYDFDGYLGSGVELQKLIREHGADAFLRTTVSCHQTEIEAFEAEKVLIAKLSLNSSLALLNSSTGSWSGSNRQQNSSRDKLERHKSCLIKTKRDLEARLAWSVQNGWSDAEAALRSELYNVDQNLEWLG